MKRRLLKVSYKSTRTRWQWTHWVSGASNYADVPQRFAAAFLDTVVSELAKHRACYPEAVSARTKLRQYTQSSPHLLSRVVGSCQPPPLCHRSVALISSVLTSLAGRRCRTELEQSLHSAQQRVENRPRQAIFLSRNRMRRRSVSASAAA